MAKAIGICKEDKNKIEVYSAEEVDALIKSVDEKTVTHSASHVWNMPGMILGFMYVGTLDIPAGQTKTVAINATAFGENAYPDTACIFPTVDRYINTSCKISLDAQSVINADNAREFQINVTNLGSTALSGIRVNALFIMEAKNV